MPAAIKPAPMNIWKEDEFDSLVMKHVSSTLDARRPDLPPPEDEIANMASLRQQRVQFQFVAGGNCQGTRNRVASLAIWNKGCLPHFTQIGERA
jgi:hypothetical protein